MKFHCDICDKPLGNYLYGIGGVEEVAHIYQRYTKKHIDLNYPSLGKEIIPFFLPDITCNECLISRNKRKYLHTIF